MSLHQARNGETAQAQPLLVVLWSCGLHDMVFWYQSAMALCAPTLATFSASLDPNSVTWEFLVLYIR